MKIDNELLKCTSVEEGVDYLRYLNYNRSASVLTLKEFRKNRISPSVKTLLDILPTIMIGTILIGAMRFINER
jgi:hypothetical protein